MSLKHFLVGMALGLLVVAGCAGEPVAPVPPTGIDTSIAIDDLPGWAGMKTSIGEPAESTRLETYLEFWRESLEEARLRADPMARAEQEAMWWATAERALTSMVGAEHAMTVLSWMESTFVRRTGGAT